MSLAGGHNNTSIVCKCVANAGPLKRLGDTRANEDNVISQSLSVMAGKHCCPDFEIFRLTLITVFSAL